MSAQSQAMREDALAELVKCKQAIKDLDKYIEEYGKIVDFLHKQKEDAQKLEENIIGLLDRLDEQGRSVS
jgi:formate-dependent nitrite reductase cytochrome c552 subunit